MNHQRRTNKIILDKQFHFSLTKLVSGLHPFLFFLGAALFLYPRTSVITSPDQIIRPVLVIWLLLVPVKILLNGIVKDSTWTDILLSIFILGICSPPKYFFAAVIVSIVVFIIWFIGLRLKLIRGTPNMPGGLLTLIGLTLVVIMILPIIRQSFSIPSLPKAPISPIKLTSRNPLPDIYFIILDGYGRADVLEELYDFNNSDFIHFLEGKGFVVPSSSQSNYPKTTLSVPSTLNLDYIQSLFPVLTDQPFWWLMSPYIDNSRVRVSLERLGYVSISIATDWGITDNPTTNLYYSPRSIVLTDFEYFFLSKVPLGFIKPWLSKIALIPTYATHRELIQYNFQTLAKIPNQPGPKFIFAHIIAPHPPFVFDSQGDSIQPDSPFSFNDANDFYGDPDTYQQGYISQMKYVNLELENLVETLLKNSEIPPIILLQADHGPGMLTNFHSSEKTCLKERFSTFAAYYLPGIDSNEIPNDLTMVNLFRIIFNKYFQANLPLLDNINYYYKDTVDIYLTENVTSKVNTCTR